MQCKHVKDWFLKYCVLYLFYIKVINHYSPNIMVVGHPLPMSLPEEDFKSHISCHHRTCMKSFLKKKASANVHCVCYDSNECMTNFPNLWQANKTTTLSNKMDSLRGGVLQDIREKCKEFNGCPFHMVRTSFTVFSEIEIDYISTNCFLFIFLDSNWCRV